MKMSRRPLIFAIEGNIGVGKSTLLTQLKNQKIYSNKLGRYLNIVYMQEPVDTWSTIVDKSGETILEKYYKDQEKYSFPFQIMAYTTRLTAMRKIIETNPECDVIICERSLEADNNVFAKMLHDSQHIEDISYNIYKMLFNETAKEYAVNGIVYLRSDPRICLERIGKRARGGENKIQVEYLESVDKYYEEWFYPVSEPEIPRLFIDTNRDVKYENDEGNQWILSIMKFIENQTNTMIA
jgi:deoxycitidine kinase